MASREEKTEAEQNARDAAWVDAASRLSRKTAQSFPTWIRCPRCGYRWWVYTARHLGSIRKLRHRQGGDMRRPFCDGMSKVADGTANHQV